MMDFSFALIFQWDQWDRIIKQKKPTGESSEQGANNRRGSRAKVGRCYSYLSVNSSTAGPIKRQWSSSFAVFRSPVRAPFNGARI